MTPPDPNRRFALEAAARVPDAAGGFIDSWTRLGWLWGEFQPRDGREVSLGGIRTSAVRARIVIRASAYGAPERPVAGQRLREGERIFRIEAVREFDEDGHWLVCHVREELAS